MHDVVVIGDICICSARIGALNNAALSAVAGHHQRMVGLDGHRRCRA